MYLTSSTRHPLPIYSPPPLSKKSEQGREEGAEKRRRRRPRIKGRKEKESAATVTACLATTFVRNA